ncbi:hypothetical protein L345_07157, partial [Ophiophagus hannah]
MVGNLTHIVPTVEGSWVCPRVIPLELHLAPDLCSFHRDLKTWLFQLAGLG